MYETGPSADELAAFGLLAEDVQDDSVIDVWPENWLPMQVFLSMRTQWRVGMGGPTGLDYGALPSVLDIQGVKRKERQEVFLAVQTMEQAALKVFAENTKDQ